MPSVDNLQLINEEDGVEKEEEMTEIDQLVSQLTVTLRLKAKQKLQTHKQALRSVIRPYPKLSNKPCCNISKPHRTFGRLCRTCDKESKYPSESHELLKYLLQEGNLIKEAVTRLQLKHNIEDNVISSCTSSTNKGKTEIN